MVSEKREKDDRQRVAWQDGSTPCPARISIGGARIPVISHPLVTDRKTAVNVMIVVNRQPELLQVVLALRPPSGFACLLNSGQQQRNQDCDNCDDHQQLDQGKAAFGSRGTKA